MKFVFLLLFLFFQTVIGISYSFANANFNYNLDEYKPNISFDEWKKKIIKKAYKEGIKKEKLEKLFKDVYFDLSVIKKDRTQPEFLLSFPNYYKKIVTKKRIEEGRKYLKRNKIELEKIRKKYGVPENFIIAFWGIETNYGKNLGGYNVLNSISTLAYDLRRRDFFEKELISLLRLAEKNNLNLKSIKGSWAGAIGNMQFIPSTYEMYGVDGNDDGVVDLWNNKMDFFSSAANFLNKLGWEKNQEWGEEVIINFKDVNDINIDSIGLDFVEKINYWSNKGVKSSKNTRLGSKSSNQILNASLIYSASYKEPLFLVYDNFKTIMKWNNSKNYSLAVSILAESLSEDFKLNKKFYDNRLISVEHIKKIQKKLNVLGFGDLKVDGKFGNESKKALRKFQKLENLPVDGFLNKKLILLIEKK